MSKIPFNRPYLTGKELVYIKQSHNLGQLSGDGPFTKKCQQWLEGQGNVNKSLLTHSCTAALEMSALLLNIKPNDEIIMPSYTFVSTANAFVLRGGVPVFIDIREDTLNMDEILIEAAITEKTKAIVPVHYAGVGCEMDAIMDIAKRHDLYVIEDAAQGVMASYKGKSLGSIGDAGVLSFHETKNVVSGEGGAILLNRSDWINRAEIIREKGTDRSQFFRHQVDKYTWQDLGSSFLPGELTAAFLWAQFEQAKEITNRRLNSWEIYHQLLVSMEDQSVIRRPIIPSDCQHNAHMYYVLLSDGIDRSKVLDYLNNQGINTVFHYVPLHSSPAGKLHGRQSGLLKNTDSLSSKLIRLPLWIGITRQEQKYVVDSLKQALEHSTV